ncbi:MAG: sensor domain-containing diguanylate cyclase [Clostridia bacterium]|nr:sensor domain-containing diguanylate cyclase [Clostridia bacterium]
MRQNNHGVIVVILFCVLMLFYGIVLKVTFGQDRDRTQTDIELNAKVYSEELKLDYMRAVGVTNTLEAIAMSGNVDHFETIGEYLVTGQITSIQLAPGGIIEQAYPGLNAEIDQLNLMKDPDMRSVAAYATREKVVAMHGPLTTEQGVIIEILNPVFRENDLGERRFWGVTCVSVKVPELFEKMLETLEAFDCSYILTVTSTPYSGEFKVVASSHTSLSEPVVVEFELGGCTWKLAVAPENGWTASTQQNLICILGMIIVVFVTTLTWFILTLHERRVELKHTVDTDMLTGLYSRLGFYQRFEDVMSRNPDKPVTGVFLDIDDFKLINDVYGHNIGDEALHNLGVNLRRAFGNDAIIGRTGGDEFGVILPGVTADEAEAVIRAASAMDQTFTTTDGKRFTYTISMGYSDYPKQAGDRDTLVRNMDKALYNVKLNGKNGCQVYMDGMEKVSRVQFGFSQKELNMNIPGASYIREAEGKQRILFANPEMIRLCGCENWEEFQEMAADGFRCIVYEEDYPTLMIDIRDQMVRNTSDSPVYSRFRVVTKDKQLRHVAAQAKFKSHEKFGDVFYVSVLNMDRM